MSAPKRGKSVLLSTQLLTKQRQISGSYTGRSGGAGKTHHSLVLPSGCISRAEVHLSLPPDFKGDDREQDFITVER